MIIIGAGISGLATGCYAQMNGFDAHLYEMHDLPGGVCTSWKRKGYLFDHCLHWVLGSHPSSSIYKTFEELGVGKEITYYQSKIFRRIQAYGKTLNVYTDIDQFQEELHRCFPQESHAIRKMCALVRFYTRFSPPMDKDFGKYGPIDILKMLPYMPSFLALKKRTIQEYLTVFQNPEAQSILFQMFPVHEMPALMAIMPMAFFHNKAGGYPMGGSLHFARMMESRLLELGGTIHYRHRVRKILSKGNQATGIETDQGQKIEGSIIVSACDGRTTLFDMLDGAYIPSKVRKMYDDPQLWPSLVNISIGIDRDLSGEPELNCIRLDRPFSLMGTPIEWINYAHYCHDTSFAPHGKSAVKVQLETDYAAWKDLSKHPERYREEKDRILNQIVDRLESIFPGIRSQIETTDVATPVTWERYTGNWQGSYQGWKPTVDHFGIYLPRQLPGLDRFFMTGQWTFPGGGVPMCMMQARLLLQQICKQPRQGLRS